MSVQCCHKAFQLVVNASVPAPDAYLAFEGNVGGEIVDDIGGKNFTINVAGSFAAGKHNNGWTGGGIFGGAHNHQSMYYSAGDPLGFTCRVWVYMNAFGGSNAENYVDFQNTFRLNIDWMGNIQFRVVRAAGFVTCASAIPSAGVWHHIMMYWDRANLKIGIKVNDGVAVEAAHNNTTVPFANDNYVGSTNLLVAQIDELAWWKNKILTPAQMTLDYNAGLGLFWPW